MKPRAESEIETQASEPSTLLSSVEKSFEIPSLLLGYHSGQTVDVLCDSSSKILHILAWEPVLPLHPSLTGIWAFL